jgi:transposase
MTTGMNQIHRIKELQRKQFGAYQIAKELNLDPKTVKKYMEQEDFSPRPPVNQERKSKLDPFKPLIDQWLLEDEQYRRKQRHTRRKVYERLKEMYPSEDEFNCSYITVARYVSCFRSNRRKNQNGYLELIWHPAEAQADYGECDILENGNRIVCRYLVVTFPQSNAGFVQCFRGETAECLCQGLQDIFFHIGGAPRRLILDNATGAGRRIGEVVRMTQLFMRFQAHYGFEVTFCNPASGHEKGNVENKVGYARRNYFVPIPSVSSMQEWNQELFQLCGLDNAREHYKKGTPICELFLADKKALIPLPNLPFEACRYERVKTDRYGKFCLDGCHSYSSSPMYAEQEIVIRIGAHFIEPLDTAGEIISQHIRQFGKERTDTTDWTTMLDQIIAKPGAWKNSIMREQVSYDLRDYLDDQDKSGLKHTLKILRNLSSQYGLDIALASMQEAITRKRVQGIDINATVLAARISSYGLDTPSEPGPDLSGYDQLLPGYQGGITNGTK